MAPQNAGSMALPFAPPGEEFPNNMITTAVNNMPAAPGSFYRTAAAGDQGDNQLGRRYAKVDGLVLGGDRRVGDPERRCPIKGEASLELTLFGRCRPELAAWTASRASAPRATHPPRSASSSSGKTTSKAPAFATPQSRLSRDLTIAR